MPFEEINNNAVLLNDNLELIEAPSIKSINTFYIKITSPPELAGDMDNISKELYEKEWWDNYREENSICDRPIRPKS